MSLRDEEVYDRPGRRARAPVHLDKMERLPERLRRPVPQFQRRSSSAGPLVVRSRKEEGGRIPREFHEHEEIHIPYRARRRSPVPAVEMERERDEMFLRRPRRRPKGYEGELDLNIESRNAGRAPVRAYDDTVIIARERESRERVRGRDVEQDEIVVRHRHARSPSSSESSSVEDPRIVRAPTIHQDVVTHHRHVEHGYDTPPSSRRIDEIDEIEPQRRRDRRHRQDEFIIRTSSPKRREEEDAIIFRERDSRRRHHSLSDLREEAAYYARIATENSTMGEAYQGATQDWTAVDVPPGTKRVTMDGIGGASQEISWQHYNGARRSRFHPSGSNEFEGSMSARYVGGGRRQREGSYTEITKDLVIREVIEQSGYDFEETDRYYHVYGDLHYDNIAALVRSSDEYRRRRVREVEVRRPESPPRRLAALPVPGSSTTTVVFDRSTTKPWERERVEREVIIDEWR